MPDVSPSRRAAAGRIAMVLAVAAIVAVAFRLGLFARLADPDELARDLAAMGGTGCVAFVVAYAILQPFGVPGTAFVMAAPLIWPWPVAFALSMTGTMAASVIGFSFARYLARDWVAARIPRGLRKYDEALGRRSPAGGGRRDVDWRGFATVFALRFVLWMPQALHFFLGVSRVSFATHFWGSLAGYAIPLLVVSFFGGRVYAIVRHLPTRAWLAIAAGVVAAWGIFFLARRVFSSRRRPTACSSSTPPAA